MAASLNFGLAISAFNVTPYSSLIMYRLYRLPGRILLPLRKLLWGQEIETRRASSVRFEKRVSDSSS